MKDVISIYNWKEEWTTAKNWENLQNNQMNDVKIQRISKNQQTQIEITCKNRNRNS